MPPEEEAPVSTTALLLLLPASVSSSGVELEEPAAEVVQEELPAPVKNASSPFCHEGVGHIFMGLPPPALFFVLEVGEATGERVAGRDFLGALAATAVEKDKGYYTRVARPYPTLTSLLASL